MKLSFKTIARYLMHESDSDEEQRVKEHMQADETLAREINKFQHLLSMKAKPCQITDMETKWQEVQKDIEKTVQDDEKQKKKSAFSEFASQKHQAPRFSVVHRYAAAAILIIAVGILMHMGAVQHPWKKSKLEYKEVAVGYQERFTLSLKDGTRITLDAGSELRYPTEFRETRDIYLRGEAFFEVAHDEQKQFQVHAGDALIRVLGTKFNVRHWGDQYDVVVTVNEGRISLQPENIENTSPVILTKAQQCAVKKDGSITPPKSVDPAKYLSWMHNEMHFENATAREVLNQLERWYGFTFEVPDHDMLDQALTIHIQKTTVNDVIQLIGIITETDVVRSGNNIKFVKK